MKRLIQPHPELPSSGKDSPADKGVDFRNLNLSPRPGFLHHVEPGTPVCLGLVAGLSSLILARKDPRWGGRASGSRAGQH